MHTYIHTYIHTFIYTFIHTSIHTHTHTHTPPVTVVTRGSQTSFLYVTHIKNQETLGVCTFPVHFVLFQNPPIHHHYFHHFKLLRVDLWQCVGVLTWVSVYWHIHVTTRARGELCVLQETTICRDATVALFKVGLEDLKKESENGR